MSRYDSLVGQCFRRNGERYAIIKCEGATVMASVMRSGREERVFVSLAEALDALEVTEINLTELPTVRQDRPMA